MQTATAATPALKAGRLRWYVCGLLFYATTVNYVDRQVLGLLKPVIATQLHWSEADFGWVVFAFQAAYALMLPIAGRLIDWMGTRLGYTVAVALWSLASMSHALARNSAQFAIARFALGLGEAANFPVAIKTVREWFPASERALATGIFNSGSNIGALVAPLLVPVVAAHFGWRASFLATGALDVVWIVVWVATYQSPEKNRRLGEAERRLIQAGLPPEPSTRTPYKTLLTSRSAWAFLLGKFCTDPVWWFYLFWLPGFLSRQYGLDLSHLGPPLVVVYLSADIGSIGGGWLSGYLLRIGFSALNARKAAMLLCAVAVMPVMGVSASGRHLWLTVGLVGLATAAHQGWSANIYTLAADRFKSEAVGSVIGLGGMGGAIGGMLVAPAVGYWLDYSHGAYGPLFIIAGSAYLFTLVMIHVLLPGDRTGLGSDAAAAN